LHLRLQRWAQDTEMLYAKRKKEQRGVA